MGIPKEIMTHRWSTLLKLVEFCDKFNDRYPHLHLSPTALSNYERGKHVPPADKYLAIIEFSKDYQK